MDRPGIFSEASWSEDGCLGVALKSSYNRVGAFHKHLDSFLKIRARRELVENALMHRVRRFQHISRRLREEQEK